MRRCPQLWVIYTPRALIKSRQVPTADALDPNATMSKSELLTRAVAPGSADIIANMHAAGTHTDEGGFLKAAENALKAGGRRVVEKTPVVRNVFDLTPPMVGTNDI